MENTMKKTGLTDLARSPKNEPKGMATMASGTRDKYGYGTSISLDAEALKKLGVTELPEVGDEYAIVAVGKVTSVSQNASEQNSSTRLEVQLTHLKLTHEDEAEEKAETPAQEKGEAFSLPGMRAR
jgi:hypothetical protein